LQERVDEICISSPQIAPLSHATQVCMHPCIGVHTYTSYGLFVQRRIPMHKRLAVILEEIILKDIEIVKSKLTCANDFKHRSTAGSKLFQPHWSTEQRQSHIPESCVSPH
jgi:hypothetical protein